MEPDDLVRLRQARDRMDRDFAQPLDMPHLARASLMSVGHFQRSFKLAFGESPYSWLMTRRVERARALFRQQLAGNSVRWTWRAVFVWGERSG